MIELRCKNNRLLGEIDPETISFVKKCQTCSTVWRHPVYHRVPLGKILNAIGRGQRGGVVYPDGDEVLPGHVDDNFV